MWTIALVMYAGACFAMFLGVLDSWSPMEFRVYWLFGAVLNVPFRLSFASNPQRNGVLNYSTGQPEKVFRFRFDVGSTF